MTMRHTIADDPALRARRHRRASVLILVVALLVLMALIGTAFIVTARTDRTAARLHTHNAQADMAVQSAVNLVVAELSADLFAPSGSPQFKFARDYRPPAVEGGNVGPFENWDAIGDAMIGPRVPVLPNPTAAPTSLYPSTTAAMLFPFDSGGVNPPVWVNVSRTPSLPANQEPAWSAGGPWDMTRYAPTARRHLGHDLWPCLQIYSDGKPVDVDPSTPEIDPIPAADADGDGIADALLWKLPVGPMNGVTYYAAVRVVDNNSAINVNTALARNFDFDGGLEAMQSPYAPSYFLGRVGLAEILRSYKPKGKSVFALGDEFQALNTYRNNALPGTPFVAGVPGRTNRFPSPFDDVGRPRPDFHFLSLCDALESQLGRRIGNPGASLGPQQKFRPFTLSDSMALGYRFCLADPGATRSAVEQVLNQSLFQYADAAGKKWDVPAAPYRADETLRWMERFRYDLEDPAKPQETFRDLRALLVARNPVANQAPSKYARDDSNPGDGDRNDTPTNTRTASGALFGGRILVDGKGIRPYEGIQPFYFAPAGGRVRATPPVPMNTARFSELWRGFWSVMTPDERSSLPSEVPQLGAYGMDGMNPYYGGRFAPPNPLNPWLPTAFDRSRTSDDQRHPELMFRSSIRDPRPAQPPWNPPRPALSVTPLRFDPAAQLLLRSALAAVNTEDLRDADDDVTSHLIELRVRGGLARRVEEKVPVRVYGLERQPYITEVYVNTDDRPTGEAGLLNPKGYVAIELFNPYPVDINVGGWSVGLIARPGFDPRQEIPPFPSPTPLVNLTNLDGSTGPPWRFPTGTLVPANGYLVLENYDPGLVVEGAASFAAQYRPDAAAVTLGRSGPKLTGTPRTVYVPNLHRVVSKPRDPTTPGGEFVLLRTRKADGTSQIVTAGTPSDDRTGPHDAFDETRYLSDLVPVDQFDFTNRPRFPRVNATMRALEAGEARRLEVAEENPDEPAAGDQTRKYMALHYVRPNGPSQPWRFVYPGRYYGRRRMLRQQGTTQVYFGPGGTFDVEPYVEYARHQLPPVLLGAADPVAHPNQESFPIPIGVPGLGGGNPIGMNGNVYPFGLFARQLDLLQVPFIGAYTVYAHSSGALPADDAKPPSPPPPSGGEIYEMNGVSMDSTFAHDTDPDDDPPPAGKTGNPFDQREQVGRFCPLQVSEPVLSRVARVDDFGPPNGNPERPRYPSRDTPEPGFRYRYRWAMDLFEQFSIHAPQNDFLPNVTPSFYKLPNGTPLSPPPDPVSNSGGVAGNSDVRDLKGGAIDYSNDYAEDLQPVEGLVNINTAPWKVLAALPMVLNPDGSVNVVHNAELAKAIVYFRDVDNGFRLRRHDDAFRPHGPFKTIFGLNEVWDTRPEPLRRFPGDGTAYRFRNGYGTVNVGGAADLMQNNEVLNRISNLITTRSDSFTCYVYVMGVIHDGAPDAEIKVQRRVAFIADRSGVRPLRPVVRTFFFNNE